MHLIPKGFNLKTNQTDKDLERLTNFYKQLDGVKRLPRLVKTILSEHPERKKQQWFYLEDKKTGEIACTAALFPYQVHICSAKFKAAELAFVGTNKAFRKKGLASALLNYLNILLAQKKYLFSFLQGLPYFYRQFGYEYAIPGETCLEISVKAKPSPKKSSKLSLLNLSKANFSLETLRLYDDIIKQYDIYSARGQALWDFFLGPIKKTENSKEYILVTKPKNGSSFCFAFQDLQHKKELVIKEVIIPPNSKIAKQAFQIFNDLANSRGQQKFYIEAVLPLPFLESLPQNTKLVAQDFYQVRVTKFALFLKALKPVLEQRIKQGPFSNLTGQLSFNFYKENCGLVFQRGRIVAQKNKLKAKDFTCQLPPFAACKLFLGFSTIHSLLAIYPDVIVKPEALPLLEELFPLLNSYLVPIY